MQQKDIIYPNIVLFLDEKWISFRRLIIAFGSLGVQNYRYGKIWGFTPILT